MTATLTLPPLMWGEEAPGAALDHAVARAAVGCDAGLLAYSMATTRLEGALVFAPEVPLAEAMVMLPLCGVGFQNALGALAPPEVAVHLEWSGGIRVNGAGCGALAARASGKDPKAVPDWLVIGFDLPLLPEGDDPGQTPDRTSLFAEGCAEVDPTTLLEAWARHTMGWISRWEAEGPRPLHAEWRGLCHGIGEDVTIAARQGTFLGVDETFGMLLRDDAGTHALPLTDLLEAP